jgi:YrbI family 3-deoxy-D-manno-octulosonate 8-phosphate phosphatase
MSQLSAFAQISSSPEEMRLSLQDRFRRIALLVVDVDGVLTDGGIVYGEMNAQVSLETKSFHVRDGSGLKVWHLAGKRSAIITGRRSGLVQVRASELGVSWVYQGAAEKLSALEQLLGESGLSPEALCYVGDDIPDRLPMRRCGLAVAVGDASPDVRAIAHYITRAPGGRGAVREVIERILRCQDLWLDSAG